MDARVAAARAARVRARDERETAPFATEIQPRRETLALALSRTGRPNSSSIASLGPDLLRMCQLGSEEWPPSPRHHHPPNNTPHNPLREGTYITTNLRPPGHPPSGLCCTVIDLMDGDRVLFEGPVPCTVLPTRSSGYVSVKSFVRGDRIPIFINIKFKRPPAEVCVQEACGDDDQRQDFDSPEDAVARFRSADLGGLRLALWLERPPHLQLLPPRQPYY